VWSQSEQRYGRFPVELILEQKLVVKRLEVSLRHTFISVNFEVGRKSRLPMKLSPTNRAWILGFTVHFSGVGAEVRAKAETLGAIGTLEFFQTSITVFMIADIRFGCKCSPTQALIDRANWNKRKKFNFKRIRIHLQTLEQKIPTFTLGEFNVIRQFTFPLNPWASIAIFWGRTGSIVILLQNISRTGTVLFLQHPINILLCSSGVVRCGISCWGPMILWRDSW